mmetsp:Transcript_34456/g.88127  ORF Transcript_34456/g.88127 Transcript_34456/m.88127 type:complete len:256 (+) Transcript_34456:1853-2620(+)
MQLTTQKEDMATTELAPNLLKGKYVRGVVTCKDCMRPRCLYSLTHPRNMEPAATMVDGKKVQPSVTEKAECKQYAMQNFHAAAEHNSFLCGMQPFDDDHPLHGVLVTRSNITCGSPVEFEYYSTQTKRATWFDATTCAWCAGVHGEGTISQILQDLWHTVLPLCEYCKSQVAKPLVRAQRRMAAEREEASRKRAARADKQRQDKEQAEQPAEEAAQPQQQPRQPRNARSSRGRKPRTANQPVTRRRSTRQYAAGI